MVVRVSAEPIAGDKRAVSRSDRPKASRMRGRIADAHRRSGRVLLRQASEYSIGMLRISLNDVNSEMVAFCA